MELQRLKKIVTAALITWSFLAVGLSAAWSLGTPAVQTLRIPVESLYLEVGDTVHLPVEGTTVDGSPASAKALEQLELCWHADFDDGVAVIHATGALHACRPGLGNVWVEIRDGRLSARPITVYIQ